MTNAEQFREKMIIFRDDLCRFIGHKPSIGNMIIIKTFMENELRAHHPKNSGIVSLFSVKCDSILNPDEQTDIIHAILTVTLKDGHKPNGMKFSIGSADVVIEWCDRLDSEPDTALCDPIDAYNRAMGILGKHRR